MDPGTLCPKCRRAHPPGRRCRVASFSDAGDTTKVGAPALPKAGGLVGVVVGGKYRVRSALGSGGMANVYEAVELHTGRAVAFKVLPPYRMGNEVAVRRFEREARLAGGLGHPNLVEVIDAGELDDGRPYIVMERLRGETLRRRIDFQGPFAPAEAVDVGLQMLSGLAVAHEGGVIHRDVKPENIHVCVDDAGGTSVVKLLDFGLAAALDPSLEDAKTLTKAGMVVGTPAYMAPEQVRGERDLDARVDLYAVGVVLYEMLCGRRAFEGADPGATMLAVLEGQPAPLRLRAPAVPRSLDAAVCHAMARERDDRPRTARELAAELAAVQRELQGSVPDFLSTNEIPVYHSTSDLEATAQRPTHAESAELVTDRVNMKELHSELDVGRRPRQR